MKIENLNSVSQKTDLKKTKKRRTIRPRPEGQAGTSEGTGGPSQRYTVCTQWADIPDADSVWAWKRFSDTPVDVFFWQDMEARIGLQYSVIWGCNQIVNMMSTEQTNPTDSPIAKPPTRVGGRPMDAITQLHHSHRGAVQGTEIPGAHMHEGERGRSRVMGHQVKGGREMAKCAHVIPKSRKLLRETRNNSNSPPERGVNVTTVCWSECL